MPYNRTCLPRRILCERRLNVEMARRRIRGQNIMIWVTDQEKDLILEKMKQAGVTNMSAYLRKMAIDGYVVRLDLAELRDLASQMRRSGANLNQLTRRVHETGRVYDADLEDIAASQARLQTATDSLLAKLTELL